MPRDLHAGPSSGCSKARGAGGLPADTLEKLLEELPRGSVLVADAEFSSRRCLELLLEKARRRRVGGLLGEG